MYTDKIKLISRREFLKLSSIGMLSSFLTSSFLEEVADIPKYGRVMEPLIYMYDRPSFLGVVVKTCPMDTIYSIRSIEIGDSFPSHNQAWFKIKKNGFIHSSQLQPVGVQYHTPASDLPNFGTLAEVTVPYTNVHISPSFGSPIAYRYYYQTTHWVGKLSKDVLGYEWYRVMDDQIEDQYYYVNARHLKIFSKEEISPLNTDVPLHEKSIEVRISEQIMIAYEGSTPVYIGQISTGDQESNPKWKTPLGSFLTYYKRPSRHMAAGNLAFGDYDLPGVPWVSYINNWGIAFHGTYWHNDFGKPRSHGCINMPPEAAKWLFRWTQPVVPFDYQLKHKKGFGTKVTISI